MSLGLALPSRPRAVRVVGSPAKAPALGRAVAADAGTRPATGGAPWTAALDRFVRDEPDQALEVLEHWITESASDDGEGRDGHG